MRNNILASQKADQSNCLKVALSKTIFAFTCESGKYIKIKKIIYTIQYIISRGLTLNNVFKAVTSILKVLC